jgi:hypothetical protein
MTAPPAGDLSDRTCALVIAHPGHELRVHHWLERARPWVFVITDGSGRTARSRLDSTRDVLDRAGARPAGIFGRFTDANIYAMVGRGDATPLLGVLDELIDQIESLSIDCIAGDALEGFNPSHDLCRFLINAVTARHRSRGRTLANFDFLLDGRPDAAAKGVRGRTVTVELDSSALDRKLAAAHGYPELAGEVESALQRFGRAAFAAEMLRPVSDLGQGLETMPEDPPYYETFGEQQVRAGHYRDVIRYREHVRPMAHALWRHLGIDVPTGTT